MITTFHFPVDQDRIIFLNITYTGHISYMTFILYLSLDPTHKFYHAQYYINHFLCSFRPSTTFSDHSYITKAM